MEQIRALVEYFQREGRVLASAPVAVTIFAILLLGGAYTAASYHFSGQIDTLKERIETLRDSDNWHKEQLSEYQRVFPGRSTDEAVKEIAAMQRDLTKAQAEILALGQQIAEGQKKTAPRHLTPDQIKFLAAYLPKWKAGLETAVIASVASPEATGYAIEFMRAFRAAGIKVPSLNEGISKKEIFPMQVMTASPDEKGVKILVQDAVALNLPAMILADMCRRLPMNCKIEDEDWIPGNAAWLTVDW